MANVFFNFFDNQFLTSNLISAFLIKKRTLLNLAVRDSLQVCWLQVNIFVVKISRHLAHLTSNCLRLKTAPNA